MNPQVPPCVNHAPNPADIFGQDTTPGTDPNNVPTYLTPDALLAYCQSRLEHIDTQVQARMQEQQNSINDQTLIEKIQGAFSKYAGGANDSNSVDDLVNSIKGAISEIQKSDPQCSALPELNQLLSDVQSGVQKAVDPMATAIKAAQNGRTPLNESPSDTVYKESLSGDQIKDYTTQLGQVTAGMNASDEINMINIQSLMSQRQTAIQLTTNMLQTLDDGDNKIVGNIGH